jgi:hypothetical protein
MTLEEKLGNPDQWHEVSWCTSPAGGHVRIPQCPVCSALTVDKRGHKEWHLQLGK